VDVSWVDANWLWSNCLNFVPPTPPPITGSLHPFGVDATTLLQPWITEPHNPYRAGEEDKRRRLIKLICKVNGKVYEEEKEVGDMKINVDDVKMVIKKILNIDVDIRR